MHLPYQIVRATKSGKGVTLLLLILISAGYSTELWAQVNLSGKAGLIYIPSAEVIDDGTFSAGYNYNPINYAVKFNKQSSESIYFVNLVVLPRFEVNLSLLRLNEVVPDSAGKPNKGEGIGDRQLDLKYVLLLEKVKRPSVAVILSAPFGVDNALVTYAVVATKHISITKLINAGITVGIGSPYYIGRSTNANDILSDFTIRDKRDLPYRYLSGPFGGVNLNVAKKGGLMIEWDSQHLNVGAYVTLFRHWTLQAGLLNGDQFTFGTSYSVNVLRLPKRLVKKA